MSAKHTPTDPALWTERRAFGAAGGPDEIVLSREGHARAFSVGAQVRRGPSEALEALWTDPRGGYLSVRNGFRLSRTDLSRFSQIEWGYLRSLGLVESFQDARGDGVRLTETGKRAVSNGIRERVRLLERCHRAFAKARGE